MHSGMRTAGLMTTLPRKQHSETYMLCNCWCRYTDQDEATQQPGELSQAAPVPPTSQGKPPRPPGSRLPAGLLPLPPGGGLASPPPATSAAAPPAEPAYDASFMSELRAWWLGQGCQLAVSAPLPEQCNMAAAHAHDL